MAAVAAVLITIALEGVRVTRWNDRWLNDPTRHEPILGAPRSLSWLAVGLSVPLAVVTAFVLPVPVAVWFGVCAWGAVILWNTERASQTIPLEVCWTLFFTGVGAVLISAGWGASLMVLDGAAVTVVVFLLAGLSLWKGGVGFGDIRLMTAFVPYAFLAPVGALGWLAALFTACVGAIAIRVLRWQFTGARPWGPTLIVSFLAVPLALAALAA